MDSVNSNFACNFQLIASAFLTQVPASSRQAMSLSPGWRRLSWGRGNGPSLTGPAALNTIGDFQASLDVVQGEQQTRQPCRALQEHQTGLVRRHVVRKACHLTGDHAGDGQRAVTLNHAKHKQKPGWQRQQHPHAGASTKAANEGTIQDGIVVFPDSEDTTHLKARVKRMRHSKGKSAHIKPV